MNHRNRFSIVALLLLVASYSYAGEHSEQPVPDYAKELMGCWQEDAGSMLNFEPARCVSFTDGHLIVLSAFYEPGTITLALGSNKFSLNFAINSGILSVTGDKGAKNYKKLDHVPEEMQLKPLEFGPTKNIAPAKIKEVQDELAKRLKTDQAVRTDPNRQNEMQSIDVDNTKYLTSLVKEFGWIDVGRYGNDASLTAFLIVQHSGKLPLMLAALPEIEKDMKAGKMNDGQQYALLYDRTKIFFGQKQRYGTQISTADDGTPIVDPLEDRKNVDQLRKEIGMPPLAEYLLSFEKSAGKKAIFADDK